jgi:hypothetical protein
MVRTGHTIDRSLAAALIFAAMTSFARAGDSTIDASGNQAPLEIPHTINVLLDELARSAKHKSDDNTEKTDFLFLKPGLRPLTWPKNSDIRARFLTTQVAATPVVNWLAENLYRSKNDNGWCLEVDPGDSKYVVFYRFHPNK